jgi:hypothetical protein
MVPQLLRQATRICSAQVEHPSACDHRVAYTVPVVGLCRDLIFLRRWPRWNVYRRIDPSRDFAVAARMNENNEGILDYFALPSSRIAGPRPSLSVKNRARMEAYLCNNTDALFKAVLSWARN